MIDAMILSIRKGKTVEVLELGLLAPVIGRPAKRRAAMAARVEAIRKRGGHIVEVETGHRSRNGQLPRMMVRGSDFIAMSGRMGNKRGRAGRPGVALSDNEREIAMGIWTRKCFENDAQRLAAIERRLGKKLKRGWCWRYFGSPSGRTS